MIVPAISDYPGAPPEIFNNMRFLNVKQKK